MENNQKPILQLRNLCKDFKLRTMKLSEKPKILHAVSNLTLDVYEGETLGVIGESGCGKSTLGRCIVQLHQPTSGEIIFDGKDISTLSKKQKHRNLQIIFQDPYSSLDPRFTCGRIIEEPLVVHSDIEPNKRKRKDLVMKIMQEVGLDVQHFHRFPHEFSGGQRQRINVARALILNPKVIVCDEPVSALDVSIQAQVLNLLSDLQKKHRFTYIFISHDLSVIKHISDRIAIMYLGHLVELCEASEIYKNPLHPYTKALLSAIPPDSPFEKHEQIELHGDIPSPIGDMIGCPLAGRCPNCMEKCKTQFPELKEVDKTHRVACFLYE